MWEYVLKRDSYREATEDRAEVLSTGDAVVLVVADGVGGRPNGAAAADAVVRKVREALPSVDDAADAGAWSRLLTEIDRAMAGRPDGGETTAVVAAVTPRGIAGASVGDSEAWVVLGDDYLDLTAGKERKPFLGVGAAFPVPFYSPLREGTLLVGTDGLFKYASPERLCEGARAEKLETAAEALLDSVRLRNGSFQDDVAFILLRRS